MNSVWKKLKNSSGISIILALGLLLICVMVSSSILMAAATGANRNINRTQQQRAYLTVSSAAQLAAAETEKLIKFQATATRETGCEHYNKTYDSRYDTVGSDNQLEGVFAQLVEDLCMEYATPSSRSAAQAVVLPHEETIIIDSDDGRLPEVICQLTMWPNYSVDMVFKTTNSSYSIIVKLTAEAVTHETLSESGQCYEHWRSLEIEQPDGSISTENVISPQSYSVYTKTNEITWSLVSIKKTEVD